MDTHNANKVNIFEREEFGNGGMLIFKLCIDQRENRDMTGRIYCGYAKQFIMFRRLNDGLRILKRVLIQSRAGADCDTVFSKANGLKPMTEVSYWNYNTLHRKKGKLGNVYLRFCYDDSENVWTGRGSVICQNQAVYFFKFSKRSILKEELLSIGTIFLENKKLRDVKIAFQELRQKKRLERKEV